MSEQLGTTSAFERRGAAALAAAALLLVVIPSARSDSSAVTWASPTPMNHSRFSITAGAPLSFTLAASATTPTAVARIVPLGALPPGSTLQASSGQAAKATFRWTSTQVGDYTLRFSARASDPASPGAASAAPTLVYTVHVGERYPRAYTLTDDKSAQWAVVLRRVVARAQPTASSRAVATLETTTSDDTQNLVLVLERRDVAPGATWYRVRLPILPNNSTGWVRKAYLGELYTVHTHLYVDRTKFTATLMKYGRPIFKTYIGVGKSYWPTPGGEFYVRDKLTGFGDPFYGPVAFGTSARSAVLTDWPGGGFVGIHGTNEPGILPGRVSHGCIRMPNSAILKLAGLMPVGTPVTIR